MGDQLKDVSSDGIAAYYDNLSRFLDVARWFGRSGGAPKEATHRFLAAGEAENGTGTSPERLDLLLLDAAIAEGLPSRPRVLDAGCGLGGTIFRWQERIGGTYHGLTLSPEQVRRASEHAALRGVTQCCRFHLRNYHDPAIHDLGPSDAVIAIESLAHSPDPVAAVSNLAAALGPGGLMMIVDDMPEENTTTSIAEPALAAFKTHWQCPVLLGRSEYQAAINAAGLALRHEEDLTPRLRPRSLMWLRVLIVIFHLLRRLAPTRGLRSAFGAMLGGFYLEALYRKKVMRYRVLVAAKPSKENSAPEGPASRPG